MTQKHNLAFRKATPADIPRLLRLIRAAYRGETSRQGWTTEADLLADERIDEAGLAAKIAEPHGLVVVVTDTAAQGEGGDDDDNEGRLVSCCELLLRSAKASDAAERASTSSPVPGGTAYFGLFAVDPRRQGGGIGRRVLAWAEAYARDAWGAARVEMTVIWARADIIAWYERRGYRKTGETRPFPYAELVNGRALRDDLYFEVLVKELS